MNELTPSQKGAAAEAAITAMTIGLGLVVLRPLCEGSRDPTRNNQAQGIKWAREYEFAPAIARLRSAGERSRIRARTATLL